MIEKTLKKLLQIAWFCGMIIIPYPKTNKYDEKGIFSLKTDIFAKITPLPRALPLARCPDIVAFYASLNRFFRRHYDFAGETHPFYELVYVISGSVGITAGEEIYTLHAGQMILHPPDEFHRIRAEDDSEPHVLNLSFWAAAMPFHSGRVFALNEREHQALIELCAEVARGLKVADRSLLNEQRLRLELWLLGVLGRGGADITPCADPNALRYAAIVSLLREHLCEPLTAQDIAQLSNMSLSSLKKIFSRYAGMGVASFFTEMKMRHAVVLLESGKRVGETAAELGYTDQNYFSTVFRRVMGTVPGSYRLPREADTPANTTFSQVNRRTNMKFIKTDSYEKLSRQAANIISAQVIMKPDSVLGLATGSSPIGIYRQLIDWFNKGDVDFSEVTSINLDEYVGLTETDDQSYRYFMQHYFFDHINIKRENTFVPNGCAADLEAECAEYDARIARYGGIDLQLLGIGLDGHIGFNEPGDVFVKNTHVVDLHESTIQANARFFESIDDVPRQAVTMGMVSIMQAKKILLIANGQAKKEILEKAFFGPITPEIPASILQLHPDITVVYSEE